MISNILRDAGVIVVVLPLMIFVHELGHFLAAKSFGVRVMTFSFGFGKRLFGIKRGDTDYRVSLLPLGGYVKMAGDDPSQPRQGDPREYLAKARWQRFIILIMGPAMNVLMAAVLIEEKANIELDWPFASALATTLLLITTVLYVVYLRLTRGRSPLPGR